MEVVEAVVAEGAILVLAPALVRGVGEGIIPEGVGAHTQGLAIVAAAAGAGAGVLLARG